MTEEEWLRCDAPKAMLTHLGERISNRQLWLFACACCRRIWHTLADERSRAVVELRERLDNGLASNDEVRAARSAADDATDESTSKAMDGLDLATIMGPDSPWDRRTPEVAPNIAAKAAACATSSEIAGWLANLASAHVADVIRCLHSGDKDIAYNQERAAHCDLLREIVRNPFRPVAFNLAWHTDTAVALARQIYESRDFGAMPILADALQDAGCDSDEVLDHCRNPKPAHVRECWVIDLVLGQA